jgi:protoheme IX farnesyltransferase
MGYLMGPQDGGYFSLLPLLLGGFLVVVASNGLNQVIEKEYDKLMVRTNNRPIATGRMSIMEGLIICLITGTSGIYLLSQLNVYSAILGFASLLSYAFLYTPMKRISPISVFIGAFPGALPVLIGFVASYGVAEAEINWTFGLLLFAIQFVWQFPHFWSIAWLLHDDYTKAGFKMLPHAESPDRKAAIQIAIYTWMLIPVAIVPYFENYLGLIATVIMIFMGIYLGWLSIKLVQEGTSKNAKKLMFGSFMYLPVVQIACVLDQIK